MNKLLQVLLCSSALVLGVGSPAIQAQSVTVRATSALSDQAVQYLASVSKPQELTIAPGVKPETFMNESGLAVGAAAQFFKLDPNDIVVFHDEVDLPPAKLRVKAGGGNAGHNGLRSISAHVGNDYRRVRIGVDHPGIKDLVHAHVLGDFAKSDRPWVEALCEIIADNAEMLARGDDASFQNKVHLAMDAKGFVEPKT